VILLWRLLEVVVKLSQVNRQRFFEKATVDIDLDQMQIPILIPTDGRYLMVEVDGPLLDKVGHEPFPSHDG
jgi:hypothetical protein